MIPISWCRVLAILPAILAASQASPAPIKHIAPAHTPLPTRLAGRADTGLPNLNLNLGGLDVQDDPNEPSTPTNQPIVPQEPAVRNRRGEYGAIRCTGLKPWFNYPFPFQYADFASVQELCASSNNGGHPQGNLGGFCNDQNQVQFAAHAANALLYNDQRFQLWCLAVCYCPLDRRQGPLLNIQGTTPVRINDELYLRAHDYELVVLNGPDAANPISSSTIVARPTPGAWLTARQRLTFAALGDQMENLDYPQLPTAFALVTPTTTTTTTTTATGRSQGGPQTTEGVGGIGGIGLYGDAENDAEAEGENLGEMVAGRDCQTNSDCSSTLSSGSCSLDDTDVSRLRGCDGVCLVTERVGGLGGWQPGKDPVFYPGRCIAALAVVGISSLFGRASMPLINQTQGVSYISNGTTSNSTLGEPITINVTGIHCGCNTSFVAKDCCSYPNGEVPANLNATQRLGHVEQWASF